MEGTLSLPFYLRNRRFLEEDRKGIILARNFKFILKNKTLTADTKYRQIKNSINPYGFHSDRISDISIQLIKILEKYLYFNQTVICKK